jgi:tetratricopeptide (TPR) repeat protein
MAREPVPWHVRSWYSNFFLRPLGRNEEARREAERALEDNPLSQLLHWCLANVLEGMGLEADALAGFEKTVELDPQFWLGWFSLALHHAILGRHADACVAAERGFAIFPNPIIAGARAGLLSNDCDASPVSRVGFHLVRAEIDEAVDWAGKALDDGYPLFLNFFIRPFEPWLRRSSGWPGLMRRLNLPDTR